MLHRFKHCRFVNATVLLRLLMGRLVLLHIAAVAIVVAPSWLAVALPLPYLAVALPLPCCCLPLPCGWLLPCHCLADALLLPCRCLAIALPMPCRSLPMPHHCCCPLPPLPPVYCSILQFFFLPSAFVVVIIFMDCCFLVSLVSKWCLLVFKRFFARSRSMERVLVWAFLSPRFRISLSRRSYICMYEQDVSSCKFEMIRIISHVDIVDLFRMMVWMTN